MKERIVLIGAGSAMFTRGLVNDLIQRACDIDLALVDTDPEALAVAEGLTRKVIAAKRSSMRLTASTDRRAVLQDATAVVCTIGVGGRRAWEQDVFIPRKYGIYQPVGDTVMPGGTSRALRMIPPMVDIAKDVLDLCPAALFFNYGNPMAAVCRGVRKATGANMVGLCHGVNHVTAYLARVLGAKPEAVVSSAAGINHLTWFTELYVDGADALPRLRQIARQRGPQEDHPFSWRLFDLIGAFPAVLDRHVCEFFPQFFASGKYYGKTLGVDAYSFEETIASGDRIYDKMREDALSAKPLGDDYFKQFGGEHEQVTDIIQSLRRCDRRLYSATLPNRGQVPNLPPEAPVESPVIADGSELKPIQQKPLPSAAAGALATRFAWVETIAEAAIEGSREKFIQALILDGAVSSLETATKLAGELLEAQAKYLPRFGKGQVI